MSKQLKLDLPETQAENPKWMSQAEYFMQKEWLSVLELEWWETRGLGYKKTGMVTENSKKKDAMMASTGNPEREIILVRETEPIQLGECEVKSVSRDEHGYPLITFGPKR